MWPQHFEVRTEAHCPFRGGPQNEGSHNRSICHISPTPVKDHSAGRTRVV